MLATWVKTLYRWNFGSIGSVNNMVSNYVIVRISHISMLDMISTLFCVILVTYGSL